MLLGFACLVFQLAPVARALPAVVSDPIVVAAVRSAGAAVPDAHSQPALPVAPRAILADAESNPTSSTLRHANSSASPTQNSQFLSTIHVPPTEPGKPVRIVSARNTGSRKTWALLSLAQHGAATFDAYATRRAVSSGATERNPLLRPFAGSPSIYAAIQVAPVGLDYLAIRMQRSQHAFLRRTWWLPQAASTGLFIFSGAHNLRLAH